MSKRTLTLVAGILLCWFSACAASGPVAPSFYAREDYDGLYTQWVSVGDINGDGIPDLIASSGGGAITVLFGLGNGTFSVGPSQLSLATGAGEALLADLNGDGKADLIFDGGIASTAGGIIVCLSNGDGTFQNGAFYPAGTDSAYQIGELVVGDFNGDGVLDVAQAGPSGIWFFAGKPDGTFSPAVLAVPLIFGAFGIAAADFNEDGSLDLVVTMPEAGLDENEGDGFFVILGNGKRHIPNAPAFHVAYPASSRRRRSARREWPAGNRHGGRRSA